MFFWPIREKKREKMKKTKKKFFSDILKNMTNFENLMIAMEIIGQKLLENIAKKNSIFISHFFQINIYKKTLFYYMLFYIFPYILRTRKNFLFQRTVNSSLDAAEQIMFKWSKL